jgi:ASC-1-like (ASCH) protein
MFHELNVDEKWLTYIIKGRKTIEGRLNKNKFKLMRPGDMIIFNGIIKKEIIAIRYYNYFEDYLKTEGIDKCLPDVVDIYDGINIYRDIYSVEDEIKYGIIAIELTDY